jgi:ABC-2 type transport system ATP-binding protein
MRERQADPHDRHTSEVMEAIRLEGLSKSFRGRPAVDALSLAVDQGEVFGFLGPNGAGKTTTIRLLLGLMRPDAGRALLFGDPVPCPGRLADVGAVVEEPAFYPWMSGRKNLRVLADEGAPAPPGAVEDALELVGLAEAAGRKMKTYSQGMRQRLGLAAALLRRPRLLILDEPANGLDPAGIREFRDRFRALGEQGVTVFLSSHLLGEVERICDRVAIVDHGRLIAVGGVDELGQSFARLRIVVRPEEHVAAAALLAAFDPSSPAPGVFLVANAEGRRINAALAGGGIYADSIGQERSGLEERFLALTEGLGATSPGGPTGTSEGGRHAAAPG